MCILFVLVPVFILFHSWKWWAFIHCSECAVEPAASHDIVSEDIVRGDITSEDITSEDIASVANVLGADEQARSHAVDAAESQHATAAADDADNTSTQQQATVDSSATASPDLTSTSTLPPSQDEVWY